MSRARRLVLGLATVAVLALAGTGAVVLVRHLTTSPQERYCDEVVARRAELTDVLSTDARDVLLSALPIFEELQDRAPADLVDQWRQVVSSLGDLRDALAAADVDPATYDRDEPPAGLGAADRERIDDAAAEVGSGPTRDALAGIEQQARDVCGTPLTQ